MSRRFSRCETVQGVMADAGGVPGPGCQCNRIPVTPESVEGNHHWGLAAQGDG